MPSASKFHRPAEAAPPPPDRILNVEQAAEKLGLSVRTLARQRLEGAGAPFVALSEHRIGYSERALDAWLAGRTYRSTSEKTARCPAGERV